MNFHHHRTDHDELKDHASPFEDISFKGDKPEVRINLKMLSVNKLTKLFPSKYSIPINILYMPQ